MNAQKGQTVISSWRRLAQIEANLLRFPDSEAFRPRGIMIRQLRQRWGPCRRRVSCSL